MLSKRLASAFKILRLYNWNPEHFVEGYRCGKRIDNATGVLEQAFLYRSLIALPASIAGVVVECGSYKGSTTALLSLACRRVGRRLHVFDSFCGLPSPAADDARHRVVGDSVIQVYEKASWNGSLDDVKKNVADYGDISRCQFHAGYFNQTLPAWNEPVAFAFCDVDLRESLETCVAHLWPLLADEGILFTHEAHHYEISALFYDREWWNDRLQCEPPGLVGGGSGIGLAVNERGFYGSCLGFTVKNPVPTIESVELGLKERYSRPIADDRMVIHNRFSRK